MDTTKWSYDTTNKSRLDKLIQFPPEILIDFLADEKRLLLVRQHDPRLRDTIQLQRFVHHVMENGPPHAVDLNLGITHQPLPVEDTNHAVGKER